MANIADTLLEGGNRNTPCTVFDVRADEVVIKNTGRYFLDIKGQSQTRPPPEKRLLNDIIRTRTQK